MTATLPDPVTEAVLTVHERLVTEIDWFIGGSVAAVLHGFPKEIHDIDIFTGAEDAYRAEGLLSPWLARRVHFSSTDLVRSHFGECRVGGVAVEIIGGLQTYERHETWRAEVGIVTSRTWTAYAGVNLPIASVEFLIRLYRELGRDAEAIAMVKGQERKP